MNVMEVKNFSFTYPGEEKKVLDTVEFQIETGQFVLLCGCSGCGKTTLLRNMKEQIAPEGKKEGKITHLPAEDAGFVFQNPENQIVTDTVRHELAFGLENMGLAPHVIRQRVAETALFLGIDEWIDRSVHEISGGEKQLLNLAAVIAMRPKILLLDEPTSQLDPVARKNFLEILVRVNRELGIAVCLTEHNLEEVLALADRVLYMEEGSIAYDGTPEAFAGYAGEKSIMYEKALPASVRLYHAWETQNADRENVPKEEKMPLTVRDGMRWAAKHAGEMRYAEKVREEEKEPGALCLRTEGIWFQYQKNMPFVLKGLNVTVNRGEIHMILGGNGSGKTTLLSVLSKRCFAQRGKIRLGAGADGKKKMPVIGLLPQNPKAMFLYDTVAEELTDVWHEKMEEAAERFYLQHVLRQHPYDLSGGEQQRLALALVLAGEPELLLLDEPTKGLDPFLKEELGRLLAEYAAEGIAVVCVTHDVEFAARNAERCSILFEGEILASLDMRSFFKENAFFTTDTARILRNVLPDAVCCEDIEFV